MYTSGEEPAEAGEPGRRPVRVDPPAAAVLAVTAVITLVLGILPGAFLDIAKDATFLIR
jgi:hypothetical protein